jgi:hypothetical protein
MKKLREVLSDKSKWTTRAMARDVADDCVAIHSKEACKFCLVGALDKLDLTAKEYNLKREKIEDYIRNFPDADTLYTSPIFGNGPKFYSLSKFNDFNSWETIDTMLNELDV